jgi:hypothetical protein
MNEKNESWLRQQISQHWLTITLAAILMWAGFRDTDTELRSDIKAIRTEIAALSKEQATLTKQKAALTCAVRTIDRIADRARVELPCALDTPE